MISARCLVKYVLFILDNVVQVNPLTGVETKSLRVYLINVFCGRHGMSITMLILTLVLMMMLLLMVDLNIFLTNSIFMLRRHL